MLNLEPDCNIRLELENAKPGAVISLAPGDYVFDTTCKPKSDGVIVQGEGATLLPTGTAIIHLLKNGWLFHNLDFKMRVTLGWSDGTANYITFNKCNFLDMKMSAIWMNYARYVGVLDCGFSNIRSGVAGVDCNAIDISGRIADEILVSRCTANETGSDFVQVGIQAPNAKNIRLEHNVSSGRLGVGENAFDIKKTAGTVWIVNNTISGFRKTQPGQDCSGAMGEGIVIHEGAKLVQILDNKITDCDYGMTVQQSSVIAKNNIIEVRNTGIAGWKSAKIVTQGNTIDAPTKFDIDETSLLRVN